MSYQSVTSSQWSTLASDAVGLSASERMVLSCLAARGGSTALVWLARDVAGRGQGLPPAVISARATRRRYTQVHGLVTDLQAKGLVEYVDVDGTVRFRGTRE